MEYVKLGNISKIRTGKLDANASSVNGEYPFFTCSKEPLKIDTYSYDCECVLVAGNGDLNVKYYNGKFDAYQRTYIIEVNNKNEFDTKFVYLLIESKIEELRNKSIGGVIKYIKLGDLTSIDIPKLSICDQERIIDNCFRLNDAIKIKKTQMTKLNELIKSQFVEMFGTPLVNEKNYKVENAERICLKITDGSHYSPIDQENGYPMLSVKDMRNDGFHYDNCKRISIEDYNKMQKLDCIPKKNDVLIAKDGSYFYYGFVVKEEKEEAILSSIAMLRPDIKKINPFYLRYYMMSPEIVDLVSKNYVTGAALKRVILKGIKQIPVMIPNLDEQNRFENIVKQVDKQKFVFEKQLKKLEELQASLMQEYFG